MSQENKWEAYKQFVGMLIKNKRSLFFRGQSNAMWLLNTSFHRAVLEKNLSISLVDYLEKIIPVVQYYISSWHDEVIDLQDPNQLGSLLSLLQHHGFPTPLLDWTLSPYIAAYFAFKGVCDHSPTQDEIKIFVFDHQEWQKSFQQPLNLKDVNPFVSVIVPYARHNKRIISQQGVYTVTNRSNMIEHIKASEIQATKQFLWEFTFPVKERPAVMRELNLMGINEMTLFPGIDGICTTMKEAYFSKDEVGLTPSDMLQKFLSSKENASQEALVSHAKEQLKPAKGTPIPRK